MNSSVHPVHSPKRSSNYKIFLNKVVRYALGLIKCFQNHPFTCCFQARKYYPWDSMIQRFFSPQHLSTLINFKSLSLYWYYLKSKDFKKIFVSLGDELHSKLQPCLYQRWEIFNFTSVFTLTLYLTDWPTLYITADFFERSSTEACDKCDQIGRSNFPFINPFE